MLNCSHRGLVDSKTACLSVSSQPKHPRDEAANGRRVNAFTNRKHICHLQSLARERQNPRCSSSRNKLLKCSLLRCFGKDGASSQVESLSPNRGEAVSAVRVKIEMQFVELARHRTGGPNTLKSIIFIHYPF
ncbi:hypothetical protein Nepgr_008762 [Nepenthes gracilis]|uniref:Uncharacterized protein n=1 Tax=Nepenthes gracilis TaxID=150966 RepID=A0AAD3S9H7_NEPGR|nr:hypothetical protein Nepgr_008762 [Nepenthes gracilis]